MEGSLVGGGVLQNKEKLGRGRQKAESILDLQPRHLKLTNRLNLLGNWALCFLLALLLQADPVFFRWSGISLCKKGRN